VSSNLGQVSVGPGRLGNLCVPFAERLLAEPCADPVAQRPNSVSRGLVVLIAGESCAGGHPVDKTVIIKITMTDGKVFEARCQLSIATDRREARTSLGVR